VGVLEGDMVEREDSSEGIRKELAAHLVDDARAMGKLETSLAKLEAKIRIILWVISASVPIAVSIGLAILAKVWK
jgi:hypothetical protein